MLASDLIVEPLMNAQNCDLRFQIVNTEYITSILLEIRDSQNLAKLGLGGKPSLLVL